MAALKTRDERRRWPRVDVNLPVRIRNVALGKEKECVNERRLNARNASTWGILLEVADGASPAVGDVLEVALNLPSEGICCRRSYFLKARGRAIRVEPCKRTGIQLVAVAFLLPPILSGGALEVHEKVSGSESAKGGG